MIKNYLKTAWRNLVSNKFYSILNISGLAIGLATGIMLLFWVQHEFSYDKFNPDAQHIYRINSSYKASEGGNTVWGTSPAPLKPFAANIRDVEKVVRISYATQINYIGYQSKKIFKAGNDAYYVDDGFFKMLSFPLLSGNTEKPFPQISSIILSETTAKNIFGNDNAIGKELTINGNESFVVSGIMKDMPENTSIRKADILIPMGNWSKHFTQNGGNNGWKTIDEDLGSSMYEIYVKTKNGANLNNIGKSLTTIFNDHQKTEYQGSTSFFLQPLTSLHLTNADGNQSTLRMVQIIMWVAILILLIASINYVNLSTARAMVRMKEVGIRKMIGASKWQLFFQIMAETLLIFSIAFVLAIGLMIALMPLYNAISGKALTINLSDIQFWKLLLSVVAGTLIASGIYPAVLLSSLNPIASLKGKIAQHISASFLRKALVVVQFSISSIIIIATIVMDRQLQYVRTKDVGYNKSYVFMVNMPSDMYNHSDAVINELRQEKSVISVARANPNISDIGASSLDMKLPGNPNFSMQFFETEIDKDFIPMMNLQLAAGHNFTGTPSDRSSYIINETAAKAMGMKDDAVGKTVTYHGRTGTIIGVLKDFNFKNLKETIKPLIIGSGAWWYPRSILYVRTTAGHARDAIKAVENQYKKYPGDMPFSYEFLDKIFESQYKTEQQTGTLFTTFAVIAIFISCLGLFGLATYTAQVKTREIGIRKVHGASVGNIVTSISKGFLSLVIIAIVISIPIAYWSMNNWLNNFAYRTTINIFIFILAASVVLLIAFATIGFKAFKAARANPIKSLRTE
ncbi:ABC transporter permease [Parafilimonas sp.]|uniref:ABC transporter permease n=1 Tax=Parafilimonas sp. TaxID=1969739 RepID=UPI0039E2CE60